MREIVKEVRLKAFEELRQHVKYAPWPIDSLMIVERAIEELSKKELGRPYQKFVQVYQD